MLEKITAMAIVLTVIGMANADEPAKHDFHQLHRLSTALQDFNFPENGPKLITVWLQGSGKGVSSTFDSNEISLTQAINAWADDIDNMDLGNVVVLSDGGRTIRFIEYKAGGSGTNSPLVLRRGDVVILLVPQQGR
jgi:hypothetical protein